MSLQGSQSTLGFTYDKAGSLREQRTSTSSKLRFTHDAWNRLVKVEHINEASFPETISTRGEYEYNGLFQRVIKRSDKDITDLNLGLDEQRLLYYSGAWQIVEERVDDAWSSGHTTDRIVQYVWGLRYIDDLVLNRQDSNADGDYIDSGDFTHYALSDHQFSVIALIDSAANLIERVSYTPYGEARHHWMLDVDGDGDIDATDEALVTAALYTNIYQSGYNVDADFNRDGKVDKQDSALIGSRSFRGALPAGWISSLSVGNVIGFSGYVFNREIDAGGLYTVRFRHYDPVWGRWISRDPAGYVDGYSLYGYVGNAPTDNGDPLGLATFYKRTGDGRYWPLTEEELRKILAENGEVYSIDEHGRMRKAKHLGRQLYGPKAVVHDPHPHNPHPHVQHKNGGKGHINVPRKIGIGAVGILAFLNIKSAKANGEEMAQDLMILFQQLANASDYWTAYSIALAISLRIAEETSVYGYNNVDEIMEAWGHYRDWLRENRPKPQPAAPSPSQPSEAPNPEPEPTPPANPC